MRDRRVEIRRNAKEAFEEHILNTVSHDDKGKPYAWVCTRPGTVVYRFWVMEGPGCIVQWGDVGGLVITQGPSYRLTWLEGAMGSMDYVLGKSTSSRTEFVPEMFQTYVQEHEPGFQFTSDGDELDLMHYQETTGDIEAGTCSRDWSADVLWAYCALEKFVVLLRKSRSEIT